MTVMTKEKEALLEQLVELAGDPMIVHAVIRDLNTALGKPPTVRQIVRRILEKQRESIPSMEIAHA